MLKRGGPEAEARADLPSLALLVLPLSDDNNKDSMSTASSPVTALFVSFVHRHVALFCCQGTGSESWANCRIRGSVVVGRVARSARGFVTLQPCPGDDEPLHVACHILPCLCQRTPFLQTGRPPCRCCLSSGRGAREIGDGDCALGGSFPPLNAIAASILGDGDDGRDPKDDQERIMGPPVFGCPTTQSDWESCGSPARYCTFGSWCWSRPQLAI